MTVLEEVEAIEGARAIGTFGARGTLAPLGERDGRRRFSDPLTGETAFRANLPDGWKATRLEIEKLADHWEEKLTEARFFFPPEKAAPMRLTLRNMWSRLPLTRGDVQIFHGMLRQLTWAGPGKPRQ